MALDASLAIASVEGERAVRLGDFYPGFRRTVLRRGELVREIRLPALEADQRGAFVKLDSAGRRRSRC
jgi:CO/xanthine dehydrogenase FAD-binding subunit